MKGTHYHPPPKQMGKIQGIQGHHIISMVQGKEQLFFIGKLSASIRASFFGVQSFFLNHGTITMNSPFGAYVTCSTCSTHHPSQSNGGGPCA